MIPSSEMHILYQSGSQQAVQPDEASAKCQLPQRSATRGDTKAVKGLSKSYCANSVLK